MVQGLYSLEEVKAMILKGDSLLLAGDAALLADLPKGKWIAGAVSRFIEKGKTLVTSREKIFVHNVTDVASDITLKVYETKTVHSIYEDAFENGFSVLIVPYMSEILNEYAVKCTSYVHFGTRVVCGWVALAPIFSEYERNDESLVFSGETGMSYTNALVVMHVALPAEKYAEVYAFSPFKPDEGDKIIFEEDGQQIENVLINGKRQNFRQYFIDRKIDRSNTACNMLAGIHSTGLIMNVGIHEDTETDQGKYVSIGAPVYKGIPYCLAKADAETSYRNIKKFDDEIVFSLSCITNYVCPEIFLEHTDANGPFAYGEIAYFLLNHATVYLTVGNITKK